MSSVPPEYRNHPNNQLGAVKIKWLMLFSEVRFGLVWWNLINQQIHGVGVGR
jgi:hypothetical protein